MDVARRGFTLVELLIALTLMSILAAVAIPNMSIGRHQAEAAMQTLGSDLLAAQRMAITRQHDIIVEFDVDQRTVHVVEDANNDGSRDADEHVSSHPLGDGVAFGHGGAPADPIGSGPITFTQRTDGNPSVTFHRDGSASEAGGVYVQSARDEAAGRPDGARLLVVDRATGRPSWFRYSGGAWQRGF
jgi:prepilin-type N-terminal cleavage/methylation domain-containing protein